MSLKEIIQDLCKQKGVTAQQVEEKLGFAKGYISKLDKSTPNSARLQKIADFFGVTYDYLMTGGKEPLPSSAKQGPIGFNDFTYAMHNETKNLSQESKDRLLQMARFFAEEERKRGNN